jgi:hypothetical protein
MTDQRIGHGLINTMKIKYTLLIAVLSFHDYNGWQGIFLLRNYVCIMKNPL